MNNEKMNEWMEMIGNEWKWMGMNGNECKWMEIMEMNEMNK